MIHIGKNTRSTIVSKGISAGHGQNTYRGAVQIGKNAHRRAQLLAVRFAADRRPCGAHTFPYLEIKNTSAKVEHEASTSKIGEDQIFYCRQRGISTEDAVNMIVSGFCKEVFRELPDGVRRRSAEAAVDQPRRIGGLSRVLEETGSVRDAVVGDPTRGAGATAQSTEERPI